MRPRLWEAVAVRARVVPRVEAVEGNEVIGIAGSPVQHLETERALTAQVWGI